MRRLHLIEIHEQPWCPAVLRDDAVTDYLRHVIRVTDPYAPILPRLFEALRRSESRRVVDLCSGGGGPWPSVLTRLDGKQVPGQRVEVCLTDLFPNVTAWEHAQEENRSAGWGDLTFWKEPVDAARLPAELSGFRTLFSSFHHFRPEAAASILRNAASRGEGIGIFEATHRSVPALLLTLLVPLMVLLMTPAMRPFRLSRLFWTYVVPAVPLIVLWDGLVSCLRTYTPEELRTMTGELAAEGYVWETGEERGPRSPVPVTYLIGSPVQRVENR